MFPANSRHTHVGKRGSNGSQDGEEAVLKKVIVVAVRAEKDISKTALVWALTHVVHPGDCITLLAVFSSENRGRRVWSFPRLGGDCASRHREKSPNRICQISDSCSQMVLQFHDPNEVSIRIKVVSGSPAGAVAAESKRAGASWVVLDKQLKTEEKHCMEELHCNIVAMKHSQPKVLRLNLGSSDEFQPFSSSSTPESDHVEESLNNRVKHTTPVSSPDDNPKTSITRTTTTEEASVSSSDTGTSIFVYEQNPLFEGFNNRKSRTISERVDSDDPVDVYDSDKEGLIPLFPTPTSSVTRNYLIPENHIPYEEASIIRNYKNTHNTRSPSPRTLLEKFAQFDRDARLQQLGLNRSHPRDQVFNSDIREVISLSRTSSTPPPPLCSLCQHKAPVFGKPPRWFDYEELEDATDGFCEASFLGESGFGSVHRGVLRDGQMVAVTQLEVAGSQGDSEFCREVEVLSCAQHKYVVKLIGFCIENRRRILVYEYICNGSLDFHLHGYKGASLDWPSRFKIAIGTARGLRYLHEDCRVGCIIHGSLRPNNILLTHDFEPLVGDFGLAKWRPASIIDVETTLGYLAPEYAEGAKITEKTDVYAYGVVLSELITGQRASDLAYPKGQQFLSKWSRPLLELEQSHALAVNHQLLDPRMDLDQVCDFSHQIQAIAHAASLCLHPDPDYRPPMSKVLRILGGGDALIQLVLESNSIGSRSERMRGLISYPQSKSRSSLLGTLSQ